MGVISSPYVSMHLLACVCTHTYALTYTYLQISGICNWHFPTVLQKEYLCQECFVFSALLFDLPACLETTEYSLIQFLMIKSDSYLDEFINKPPTLSICATY